MLANPAGLDCKMYMIDVRTVCLNAGIIEEKTDQRDYTEDMIKRFDMKGCNPTYKPGEGPKISLYQPKGGQEALPMHHGCHFLFGR